jgi:hypothetical protein
MFAFSTIVVALAATARFNTRELAGCGYRQVNLLGSGDVQRVDNDIVLFTPV